MLALVAFLVPVFEKVFKDFGGELPAITKVTVTSLHFVTARWYLCIPGISASSTRSGAGRGASAAASSGTASS